MSIVSRVKSLFTKKTTTTTKEIAPTTQPSVTSVDVGTSSQERTGGFTVVGAGGLVTRRGSSGGATQPGTVTSVQGNITPEQAQRIAGTTASPDLERVRVQAFAGRSEGQLGTETAPSQVRRIREIEVADGKRREVGTTYYQEGRQVGGVYRTEKGEQYAVVRKPGAKVTVREGDVEETVAFTEQGAEITQTTYSVSPPGSVSPNYNDPIARQSLPPRERVKYAYRSAGKGSEAYGVIRAGFEVAGIISEKIKFDKALVKIGVPQSIVYKQVSSSVPESLVLSTFFLAPTTATTAQIEQQLFGVTKVKVAGVTQEVGKGSSRTQAIFTAEKGKTFVRGIVETRSKIIGQLKTGQDVIISGTKGRTFTRAYVFPTGREVVRAGKPFKSVELAVASQRGELTFTRALGSTAKKVFYRAASVGTQKGDYLVQFGGSETLKGGSRSIVAGIFKIRPTSTQNIVRIIGGGGARANINQITKSAVTQASASATKSAIGSSITIPPSRVFNIFPVVSARQTTTQQPRSTTQPSQTTISRQETISVPIQRSITSVTQRERASQRSSTLSITAQSESQRQIPRQISIPSLRTDQAQRQKFIQTQASLQLQRQESRRGFPRTRVQPRPEPKFPIFSFTTRKPSTRRQTGSYSVSVRRQGAFRQVGTGLSLGRAYRLGETLTQKGLAQSFKVRGARGQQVGLTAPRGFYGKRSKKEGLVFIERPRSKINTPSEKSLLNLYRTKSRR